MSQAVSFSRWALYNNCPASYEWQYILGNKREDGPGVAAARGTRIHNSIENAYLAKDESLIDVEVKGRIRATVLEHFSVEGVEVMPEMPFALTKDWGVTEFDADDAYVRGFMDNVFVYPDKVRIHEYKTGKEYPDHAQQKSLYGMVALIMWPEIDDIEVKGVYIDQAKTSPTPYSRSHLHSMKYTWKRNIDKMFLPMYPARPGFHCRWCPKSSKHADGPCKLG